MTTGQPKPTGRRSDELINALNWERRTWRNLGKRERELGDDGVNVKHAEEKAGELTRRILDIVYGKERV